MRTSFFFFLVHTIFLIGVTQNIYVIASPGCFSELANGRTLARTTLNTEEKKKNVRE